MLPWTATVVVVGAAAVAGAAVVATVVAAADVPDDPLELSLPHAAATKPSATTRPKSLRGVLFMSRTLVRSSAKTVQ
jgi:hypothetical protein